MTGAPGHDHSEVPSREVGRFVYGLLDFDDLETMAQVHPEKGSATEEVAG